MIRLTASGAVALAALLAGSAVGGALAASRAAPGAPQDGAANRPPSSPLPTPDAAQPAGVARARINECGHLWNSMKRAGTATGTWKDFSRGCYAQR